jgi:hypothetical protein
MGPFSFSNRAQQREDIGGLGSQLLSVASLNANGIDGLHAVFSSCNNLVSGLEMGKCNQPPEYCIALERFQSNHFTSRRRPAFQLEGFGKRCGVHRPGLV